MDRRMFDISEFYRTSCDVQPESARAYGSQSRPISSGDCADPLTMVFINMQSLESVYPLNESFEAGTLFPELNKPFYGGMSNER